MTTRINPWDPWHRRMWKRALSFVSAPETADYGVEFARGDYGLTSEYDPAEADSAAKVFAWVYASVGRRTAALASLPVEVYRIVGSKRELVEDHWLYDLIERPNSYTDGNVFIRELVKDYDLSGEAAVKVITGGMSDVSAAARAGTLSLQRLHPKKFKTVTGRAGPEGYQYDLGGEQDNLALDAVCHIRRVGFGYRPEHMFHGVGAIQPLNDELNAELNAIERAGEAAKTGRPDCVLMPKESAGVLSKPARTAIASAYRQLSRQGGALVLAGSLEHKQLSWSPRDLEFASLREFTRSAILAAFEVPPSILGLESANYATAREQAIRFWEGISTLATAFNASFLTRLLRLAGERDTYARFNIDGVQSLQLWQGDAIERAVKLVMMGYDRDVAARSQGLGHVVELQAEQGDTATQPRQRRGPQRRAGSWWSRLSSDEDIPIDEDEAAKAKAWADYLDSLHSPHERAVATQVYGYHEDLSGRLSAGVESVWPEKRGLSRDETDDIMTVLFDTVAEKQLLKDAMGDVIQDALEDAFATAMKQIDLVEISRIDELVDEVLGDRIVTLSMIDTPVVEITDTNRAAVREVIRAGLEEGSTIAEMQFAIQEMPEFSAVRSLRIARTETTRAINAGTIRGYDATEDEAGVTIQRTWLSARDAATRPEHWVLDGQTIGRGEKFTIPVSGNGQVSDSKYVGKQADAPGGFDDAGMVVNCRCTVIPSIKE